MSSENNNGVDQETMEMLRSFVSEAFDSLDTNEPIVENLRNEDNAESVNAIFRVFHTLKGLSGFFEMGVINKVTHEAETLLDEMRKRNQPQSEEMLTVIYQSFDFLRALLQRVNEEYTDKSGEEEAEDIILIIRETLKKVRDPQEEESIEIPEELKETDFDNIEFDIPDEIQDEEDEEIEEIAQFDNEEEDSAAGDASPKAEDFGGEDFEFELDSLISDDMLDQYFTSSQELVETVEKNLLDLEENPDNMEKVGETFGAIHSLKGNSGFMGFSDVEEISVEMETILDSVRSKELEIDTNLTTILLSNLETIKKQIKAKVAEEADKKKEESPKNQAPALKKAEAKPEKPKPAPEKKRESKPAAKKSEQKKLKQVEEPKPAANKKESAPKKAGGGLPPASMTSIQKKDIRVETTKIDKLFDMVGELITIETMVTNNQDLRGLELPNFNKAANMLNKITRDLQEISMSIRMMPIEGLFNKMKRLVRDVSIKMNKKVDLIVSGQETEMDKNVIDEISDPLVHILRNAIDHGVEKPEIRRENGKPEKGTVRLSARYEGNEILITVRDDGAGIVPEKILKRAEERGILPPQPEKMSNREIFQLVFEPGFSTAEVVTDISGRGVGMDVVKKNLEKLRGSVTVDSKVGEGSVFTMHIPLTLAIMEAMLIRIGDSIFALPILAIKESFRTSSDNINQTMDGLEVVRVRQDVLPIIRLHELFHKEPDSRELDKGILLIIESREKQVCLFADEIVGQQQAVIKGLSDYIGKVPGITGCMVLGDGGIGLILDIESLVDMAEKPEFLMENQLV